MYYGRPHHIEPKHRTLNNNHNYKYRVSLATILENSVKSPAHVL